MSILEARLKHGRLLFEELLAHLNADKPISSFARAITQLRFEEIRNGDNLLYMPKKDLSIPESHRHLQRGFSLNWASYDKRSGILTIKPHVSYFFNYNIDTRKLDLNWIGGTIPAEEFKRIDESSFYRIE